MSAAPEYREWRPAAELAGHLSCTWAGRLGDGGEPYVEAVLPDGCIDLVWTGSRLFITGPDTGPVPIAGQPGSFFLGARFRPGVARTMLGVPACDLRDSRVDAADVVGPARAAALAERLHGAASLRAATAALESELISWLPSAAPADGLVLAAVTALASSPDATVAAVAGRLGVSERQLHRRCTAEVGYGPKTLARVVRFRRFLAAAGMGAAAGAGGGGGGGGGGRGVARLGSGRSGRACRLRRPAPPDPRVPAARRRPARSARGAATSDPFKTMTARRA